MKKLLIFILTYISFLILLSCRNVCGDKAKYWDYNKEDNKVKTDTTQSQ
ncbi:hypothetical protein K6119_00385 [Paracrocinitomix mangrovi]|nr:hypothetical protein [Paracrocinitomix mangrovi]UKN01971.1 hypothetical protein K6119_00385 [Paracrocinitomix mangrovi]